MAIDRRARKAAHDKWAKDIKQRQEWQVTNIGRTAKGKKDKRGRGCVISAISTGVAVASAVATWRGWT